MSKMNSEKWKNVLKIVVAIATAILGAIGVNATVNM